MRGWYMAALLSAGLSVNAQGAKVVLGGKGGSCPEGYNAITDLWECRTALHQVGLLGEDYQGEEKDNEWPSGCYYCDGVEDCTDGVWFNRHQKGSKVKGVQQLCATPEFSIQNPSVLFVGDSDIDYWPNTGTLVPNSINVGVGGYTCADVAKEMKRKKMLKKIQPKTIVLICGENDLWERSVKATSKSLKSIFKQARRAKSRVLYIGTKPEPSTREIHNKYRQYDASTWRTIRRTKGKAQPPPVVAIDAYTSFEKIGNPNRLYARDKLHLSKDGYELFSTWVTSALDEMASDDSKCRIWQSDECAE